MYGEIGDIEWTVHDKQVQAGWMLFRTIYYLYNVRTGQVGAEFNSWSDAAAAAMRLDRGEQI